MNEKQESDESIKQKELYNIKCTLFIIWLIWFCIHAAFGPLEVLQSGLNPVIGIYSLSTIHAAMVVTSLLGPAVIIRITPKWMIVIGCVCHTLFIFANYYPEWFTLIPAGILIGLVSAPVGTCHGFYVTALAIRYAELTGQTKVAVLSKCNGLMSTNWPLSFLFGNAVMSLILKYVKFSEIPNRLGNMQNETDFVTNVSDESLVNVTNRYLENVNHSDFSDYVEKFCGPNYCPGNLPNTTGEDQNNPLPQIYTIYFLVSVMLCFNLCGVFLSIFGLHNIQEDYFQSQLDKHRVDSKEGLHCIFKYFTGYFDWRLMLLLPGMAYIQILHSTYRGMFTKAYISCSSSLDMIGYVSMVHALASLITHPITAFAGEYISRNILFLFSYILVLIQIGMWYQWNGLPDMNTGFIAIGVLSGISNSNEGIHFRAFIGYLFTDKTLEAFAMIHFLSGMIVAIGYFSVNYICVQTQLFTLLGIMVVAFLAYVVLILKLRNQDKYQLIDKSVESSYKALPDMDEFVDNVEENEYEDTFDDKEQ